MKPRGSITSQIAAVATLALAWLVTPAVAQNAYITNNTSNTVSVINTTTNKIAATIAVGDGPFGVAVAPNGSKVYVTNEHDGTLRLLRLHKTAPTASSSEPEAFSSFSGRALVHLL